MLKIIAPINCEIEKKYIVGVIFRSFLGLEYNLTFSPAVKNYVISYKGEKIIIKDSFFSKISKTYLDKKYLPRKSKSLSFVLEKKHELVCIYGDDNIQILKDRIICDLDIFASSFFMLSRWEEYVLLERDLHERFIGTNSYAYTNNFLNRPIVDEYVEALWDMLQYLGYKGKRKETKYNLILTHDVDQLSRFNSFFDSLKYGISYFKKKDIVLSILQPIIYILSRVGVLKDPFDTYDKLMKISESVNAKSIFFFLVGGKRKYDCNSPYDIVRYVSRAKKILDRKHYIGLHPSYYANKDAKVFIAEYNFLQRCCGEYAVEKSRNHYLRLIVPESYGTFRDTRIIEDYTLGYFDKIGFRCGTCHSYRLYDFLKKEVLKINEFPLIVMDGTLLKYNRYSKEEAYSKVIKLIDKIKYYKGNFVFLWHNSSFNTPEWKKYGNLYEKIVSYAR